VCDLQKRAQLAKCDLEVLIYTEREFREHRTAKREERVCVCVCMCVVFVCARVPEFLRDFEEGGKKERAQGSILENGALENARELSTFGCDLPTRKLCFSARIESYCGATSWYSRCKA
jgi:hypothetical protein